MTKREHKYFLIKSINKIIKHYQSTPLYKLMDSFESIGAAATHIYKDETGIIHVEVLTPNQCLDLMEWDNIPEENFTIAKI